MATDKRSGLKLPSGILAPTTRPEPEAPGDVPEPEAVASGAGQGGPPEDRPEAEPSPERKTRRRKKSLPAAGESTAVEGRRLYLSEGVHFRLRIYAYQRGVKLSEAAEELLDKSLPKWDISRVG